MRLQLTVFSLLFLALLIIWRLAKLFPARGRGRAVRAPAGGELADRLEGLFKDVLVTYAPFAAVALLMYLSGKPDRLPQWAGWTVVISQALRTLAQYVGMRPIATLFLWIAIVCLVYLWIIQLPFFQPAIL